MNNKIIYFSVLIIVILATSFLFELRLLAQEGSRFQGEIMCEVEGLLGEEKWEVIATCTSPIWWNGNYYITSNYTPVSIEGTGNTVSDDGFHSPDDTVGQSDLAYGEYEFTFDFPYPYSDVSFTLDLRDAEWSTQYPYPHDIYIKCNANNEILKKKLGAGSTYTTLNESSIWAIYGYSNPFNQAAFQPTKPENFMCYNAGEIGEHPLFVWSAPEEPEDVTFKYKIYRKEGAYSFALVASGFTDQSWTDPTVNIEPKTTGIQFTYYAKAYTDQSPDSDPSETAILYGLYIQKSGSEYSAYDCSDGVTNCLPTIFNLGAYPNPFNPSTTIRYALPTASHVMLKIFNLRGELVKTLVDGNRAANHYQVVWNGENESGVKVAAGIYLYQLNTENYSQIKRMIFSK